MAGGGVHCGEPAVFGGIKMIAELGETETDILRKTYSDRVPGFADLCCWWFEKARKQLHDNKSQRAGLVATNSIRGGANRLVLERLMQDARIFEAWSDEPWVVDGAAVRVSLVCFETDGGKAPAFPPCGEGGREADGWGW